MAKLLYQITKEDLGKTLVEIERKCADAIQRNAREDQIELNIDCLSGELVRELTTSLQAYVLYYCFNRIADLRLPTLGLNVASVHWTLLEISHTIVFSFSVW